MKYFKLLLQFIPVVLLALEPVAVKSQQLTQSSISLQYGLLHYNSYQHDVFNFDSKFRNGAITYRQQLGRLSGINFSGKYYHWSLDNFNELETYAFQSMIVFHAGKISSSWRVNRLTPYLGAGIGYQQHTLMQEGTEFEYRDFYLPLEAGLLFNISSRWSIGAFAEYKFTMGSDIKKQIGVDEKNPDIVNAAGLKLSYHLGQRRSDFSFPTVHTLPAPELIAKEERVLKQVSDKAEKEEPVQEEELKATVTVIPDAPTITFLVKDMAGQPIPGAIVVMEKESGITNDVGEYSFTYNVADTYSYTVTATAFVSRSGEVDLEGGDMLLKITLKHETTTIDVDELAEPVSAVTEPELVILSKEETLVEEDKPALPQKEALKADTIAKKVDIAEEIIQESDTAIVRELVLSPKMISTVSDTIIIPVRIDVIMGRQTEYQVMQTEPHQYQPDDQIKLVYDRKLDSLVVISRQLSSRIASLEDSNSQLMAEFDAFMKQPATTVQQTVPSIQRASDLDQSMLQALVSQDLELSRLKQNIELLTAEVQQSSLNNQIALENLNMQIAKLQTPDPKTRIVLPDTTLPQTIEPVKVPELEEAKRQPEPATETQKNTDKTIELLRIETERLSTSQRLLVEQLEELQKQNQRLLNEIAELSKQPEQTVEDVVPLSLEHTIYFAINSTAVGAEHLPKLVEFANLIKINPDKMLKLSGFADGLGDQAYNMKLSQRRVQSVKTILLQQGVPERQIVEQFFGSNKASGSANPDERKVEIKVF